MMDALAVGNKFCESVGSDRVGDDSAAWMFTKNHRCDERNERISVDWLTRSVNDGRAIHISVKNNAKIGFVIRHRLADWYMACLSSGLGTWLGKCPSGSRN